MVRSLFNHLGPFIGGAEVVQENSTARMSQVALNYRHSPISVEHGHSGELKAGDRVPDMRVRCRLAEADWSTRELLSLLDPSHFTLLVCHPDELGVLHPDSVKVAATFDPSPWLIELAPDGERGRVKYTAALGRRPSVFLVRPDGYVALAAEAHTAAEHLAEWRKRWLAPSEIEHVA